MCITFWDVETSFACVNSDQGQLWPLVRERESEMKSIKVVFSDFTDLLLYSACTKFFHNAVEFRNTRRNIVN